MTRFIDIWGSLTAGEKEILAMVAGEAHGRTVSVPALALYDADFLLDPLRYNPDDGCTCDTCKCVVRTIMILKDRATVNGQA